MTATKVTLYPDIPGKRGRCLARGTLDHAAFSHAGPTGLIAALRHIRGVSPRAVARALIS
jgi:hypothetical protein